MAANCFNLGKVNSCGEVIFNAAALISGYYTFNLDYNGTSAQVNKFILIGSAITLQVSGLNESYVYDFTIIDPEGNEVVIDYDGTEYSQFRIQTVIDYSGIGNQTQGTVVVENPPAISPNTISVDHSQALSTIVTNGDNSLASNDALLIDMSPGSAVHIIFNSNRELEVDLTSKTGLLYLSNDGGLTHKTKAEAGDKLYWNGAIIGFELDAQDSIIIKYETLQTISS